MYYTVHVSVKIMHQRMVNMLIDIRLLDSFDFDQAVRCAVHRPLPTQGTDLETLEGRCILLCDRGD